jgi:hypothetical protein
VAVDISELLALAGDFQIAGMMAPQEAKAVVSKTALEIKNQARSNIAASGRGAGYKKHYPSTIAYDLFDNGMTAEIGPEKKGQGNLGNLLEYGSVNNAPLPHLGPALDNETPRFEDELTKVLVGLLW